MGRFFRVILTVIALTCICGCSAREYYVRDCATSEGEALTNISSCSTQKYSDMPDIVFISRDVYQWYDQDGNRMRSMTFRDKNGDIYSTDNNDLCALPFDELIEKFISGDERFTKLELNCDISELEENYRKICDIADNAAYDLEYPEALPAVEADTEYWYGLYYDDAGELCYVLFHKNECMTDIYANDDRANEVYEWYIG